MLPTIDEFSSSVVGGVGRRMHGQDAAGESLAGVVVGLADERERDAGHQPRAEALAGRAVQRDVDRALRQPVRAEPLGDLAGEDAADGAVDVADGRAQLHLLAAGERRLGVAHQLPVERVVEHRLLRAGAVKGRPLLQLRHREDGAEVDAARLPVVDRAVHLEQVGAADHLVERAHADRRHQLARLLGDEEEVLDDVVGRPLEALAQLRVLGRDADRTRVQVADAHHDAAHRDQRGGREADLVGAQQRGDHDVAAGLHLAVGLRRPRASAGR